ncbi:hypothetical protein KPL70_014304 [Citrus sinensis]|nr:hypothetical protein KPL70_014304 [Citrus sinensis]
MHPTRTGSPSCIVFPPDASRFNFKPGIIQFLPTFRGFESENSYLHLREFVEVYNICTDQNCSMNIIRLKFFPFSLKDKAKTWLQNLSKLLEHKRLTGFRKRQSRFQKRLAGYEKRQAGYSEIQIFALTVPSYAKFLKDLCTVKKKYKVQKRAFLTEQVSSILSTNSALKYKDPDCPTISCTIGDHKIGHDLLDLGASVNLLPYSVYQQLNLGELKPTSTTLLLADRSMKVPKGIIEDVLVQVDKFIYPVDFIVLETEPIANECKQIPVILGRPFLAIANALINCRNGLMNLSFGDMTLELNVFNMCKQPHHQEDDDNKNDEIYLIEPIIEEHIQDENFTNSAEICFVGSVESSKELDFDTANICPTLDSMQVPIGDDDQSNFEDTVQPEEANEEEAPELELKPLPEELKYVYLGEQQTYPVVISSQLTHDQEDQILKRVAGHPYYCFLDGYSGYYQIPIALEDQENTTFTCPFGTFSFRRMPFGLCNAPATFQRCMLSIFSDMAENCLEVFMDDLTVFGLIVSSKGIEVDKAKVEVISKLPSPKTIREVRSLLGHSGFYRRFIKDFSALSRPICNLLIKDTQFEWTKDCQQAFEKIISLLTSAPIMQPPDWSLPFELMCNASDYAIGAVLGQKKEGKPFVIYYASRTLNTAQMNYTTTEKELLAVIFALDKFRSYLIGSSTVVYFDHAAVRYLMSKQDAKPRLIRWILLLQEFNLTIKDKKGAENVIADYLSRLTNESSIETTPINDSFPDEFLFSINKMP